MQSLYIRVFSSDGIQLWSNICMTCQAYSSIRILSINYVTPNIPSIITRLQLLIISSQVIISLFQFLNINTETADIVQVLVGALTEDFAVMKGKIFGVKQNVLYNSFNNYMIIKFFSDHTVSDHTVQRRGFTANYWSREYRL